MLNELYIDHLIIVTGPTSSGKSTLLRTIQSGELNEEIKSLLPEDVGNWPNVPSMNTFTPGYIEKLGSSKDNPLKGMVMHYDFIRPFKKILKGYEQDNIDQIINRASSVTVFIIKPDKEVLLKQLKKGELEGGSVETAQKDLLIRRFVTRLFHKIPEGVRKKIKKLLFSSRKGSVTDFNKILFYKYQEDGWVDEWYLKFETYLESKNATGKPIDIKYVKPSGESKQKWVLLIRKKVTG